jgi:hypothetical protein
MPSRRGFLGSLAVVAAGCSVSAVAAPPGRRSRQAGVKTEPPNPPVKVSIPPVTRRDDIQFAHKYSDKEVELAMPDLARWQKLKVGMPRDQVRELLGLAMEEGGGRERDKEQVVKMYVDAGVPKSQAEAIWKKQSESSVFIESWRYGRLEFISPQMPTDFSFSINLDDHKVVSSRDPFGGRLSLDGRPTTPALMLPYDHSKFDHGPMFVDTRWQPSCGEYPMEYRLELTFGHEVYDDRTRKARVKWYDAFPRVYESRIPYLAIVAPGENSCRWRVKAKNRLGESGWSEYRHFKFGREA